MSLQLIPKAGMLLVKPIAPKPASSGLITLADVYREPETTGEIIGMGDMGRECENCGMGGPSTELQEGDVILFAASSGDELEWQGERYLLIPESDVLAVISEAPEGIDVEQSEVV